MSNIRVFLADDHAVVREGLKSLIARQPGMEVVGEAADGPSAIALTAELDPDVVVVDVSLPQLDRPQAIGRLRDGRPDRKVLAFTVHEGKGDLHLMLGAGVAGYILKRAAAEELMHAIRVVAAGGTYLDPTLARSVVDNFLHPARERESAEVELSEREAEVVRLIALGYSNKEIAARLTLSVKTIETYKTRSMEKLGIRSRVELVQYAVRRGWFESA